MKAQAMIDQGQWRNRCLEGFKERHEAFIVNWTAGVRAMLDGREIEACGDAEPQARIAWRRGWLDAREYMITAFPETVSSQTRHGASQNNFHIHHFENYARFPLL